MNNKREGTILTIGEFEKRAAFRETRNLEFEKRNSDLPIKMCLFGKQS